MIKGSFGLISVIMAAYNAEQTVEEAIRSVLRQTYSELELLVIDDGSTDGTLAVVQTIAKTDQRVRLIQNPHNMGVSASRKRGLKEAAGEWIAILDSDDAWEPDKLEKQITLQEKTGAELLFTGSAFMSSDGKRLDYILQVPEKISYRQLLKQNLISNSSALVRRSLYRQFYTSGDMMHEDFATWLKILRTGREAYSVNEPLLIYRLAKSSKSGNKIKSAKMNWNTYRNVGLPIHKCLYYMGQYTFRSIRKYSNLVQ